MVDVVTSPSITSKDLQYIVEKGTSEDPFVLQFATKRLKFRQCVLRLCEHTNFATNEITIMEALENYISYCVSVGYCLSVEEEVRVVHQLKSNQHLSTMKHWPVDTQETRKLQRTIRSLQHDIQVINKQLKSRTSSSQSCW